MYQRNWIPWESRPTHSWRQQKWVWLKDKPPQTTANHHKPPQTTTHHRKPPQTTTRIWDDNTSVWPCAVKKRLNHRKPPQTTSRIWDYRYSCAGEKQVSSLLTRIDLVIQQSMFLFNSFFGLFLRPLLELAITQHVAPPCDQTHCSLP